MSKRNLSVDGPDILLPSTEDTRELFIAVFERAEQLYKDYLKYNGVELKTPKSLNNDLVRWLTMKARFESGDFRNTRSELLSLREIAVWTHKVNCKMRGQPFKHIGWKD